MSAGAVACLLLARTEHRRAHHGEKRWAGRLVAGGRWCAWQALQLQHQSCSRGGTATHRAAPTCALCVRMGGGRPSKRSLTGWSQAPSWASFGRPALATALDVRLSFYLSSEGCLGRGGSRAATKLARMGCLVAAAGRAPVLYPCCMARAAAPLHRSSANRFLPQTSKALATYPETRVVSVHVMDGRVPAAVRPRLALACQQGHLFSEVVAVP